jgi:hypothetical protein
MPKDPRMLSWSRLKSLLFGAPYSPRPDERPFLERLAVQEDEDLIVRVAVLDDRESDRFFGVRMARRGMQPVWVQITNRSNEHYRLRVGSMDPYYFPPLEAAYINHHRVGRRVVQFGILALLFIYLLLLLPFRIIGAWRANRLMDEFFQEQGIGWDRIYPGETSEGFVFTNLDEGTKQVTVKLLGQTGGKEYQFSLPVPGLHVDHHTKELDAALSTHGIIECDEPELQQHLTAMPRSTTNSRGTLEGDPLNLVVVGEFETIISGFGSSWDETEAISLLSCWRTVKSFTLGHRYRYSPVSSLYFEGRSQDFALQKARETINERLHLRLWLTPLRFEGKSVWVGQISRDIGVRFTLKTWNLTTHKIDPDVDDSRDYVLNYLLEGGRVERAGYVPGVESAARTSVRHNLTGDPYFTDGLRAVAILSATPVKPSFLKWT